MTGILPYLDPLLFAAFPYVALCTFLLVTIQRYRSRAFTYSSLSSQFLENKQHFWAMVPFHYGIIILLAGHLIGLLIPLRRTAVEQSPAAVVYPGSHRSRVWRTDSGGIAQFGRAPPAKVESPRDDEYRGLVCLPLVARTGVERDLGGGAVPLGNVVVRRRGRSLSAIDLPAAPRYWLRRRHAAVGTVAYRQRVSDHRSVSVHEVGPHSRGPEPVLMAETASRALVRQELERTS